MRELINVIPFFDVISTVLLAFFIYVGWKHGTPKALLIIASIYTGFLLASIYYHLTALFLVKMFGLSKGFASDLIGFITFDLLVSLLMVALLLNLFSHVKIGGKLMVFDRIMGALLGLVAGGIVISIFVTMMKVPYEDNKQNVDVARDLPLMQLFNSEYNKSILAPRFVLAAPLLATSVKPMLPPEAQKKGAVPLLAGAVPPK